MKKRQLRSKQSDLFTQDSKHMQWHDLSLIDQRRITSLLAKFFLYVAIESQTEETSDADENSF